MIRTCGGPGETCGESGFTFIEILVAFAIVALAMSALMQIFSTGLRSGDTAEKHTTAVLLAESKLESIGIEDRLVEGETSGIFDNGFRWRSSIRAYDDGGNGDRMGTVEAFTVSVTVAWDGWRGERSFALETLRLATEP